MTANPQFTLCSQDAAKGFTILSAKDSQAAFLRGLGSKDLIISGDFQEVIWFQGLTAFLQPPKKISPYDRTTFGGHYESKPAKPTVAAPQWRRVAQPTRQIGIK